MEATASMCLFAPTTIFPLVPPLLSFLGGGEALFLRYGCADNVCIINALTSERSTIAPTSSLRFSLAHAHAHINALYVCLFPLLLSVALHLSFYHRNKIHTLSMTTNDNGVRVHTGNSFF
jgi:hypothetical protein